MKKYIHCKTHAHIPSRPHQVTTITVDMPTFSNNSESKIRLVQKETNKYLHSKKGMPTFLHPSP